MHLCTTELDPAAHDALTIALDEARVLVRGDGDLSECVDQIIYTFEIDAFAGEAAGYSNRFSFGHARSGTRR